MKGYKFFIPVGFLVLMALSIFSVISNANKKQAEYDHYLSEARRLAELDVIEDSLVKYKEALSMKNTVGVALEVGKMFQDHEWDSYATAWGEKMIEDFPSSKRAYTYLLSCYIKEEKYAACFDLQDTAKGKHADSDSLEKLMDSVMYKYELGYDYYTEVGVYSNGYCAVKSDGNWGYANYKGEKKIGYRYLYAGPFNSDLIAAAQDEKKEYYYIAKSGNKKIAVQNMKKCSDLGMLIDGIIPASDGKQYGYYDENFKELTSDRYDYATAVNKGVGAVQIGDKWYLTDGKGKMLSDAFAGVAMDAKGIVYRNERAFVKNGDKFIMVDGEGKRVGEGVYDDAYPFLENDGLAAVKVGINWGFIDKEGNMVIEPSYDEARSTSNGYAAVCKNHDWGFMNKAGNVVIDYSFDDARDFNDRGTVFVEVGNTWRILKLYKDNYKSMI